MGQVDFGLAVGDCAEMSTQTDSDLFDSAPADEGGKKPRKNRRGSGGGYQGEPPIERMLRLSRIGRLKLEGDGRVLPPRIASRMVMQLMLDKGTRGSTESLPDFLYNFYLHMYGVRKLAEQNLIALILSCVENGASITRLGTFAQLCGFSGEPAKTADADADMVCSMYCELNGCINQYNSELVCAPSQMAEARLPTGEDGNPAFCLAPAGRKTVRSLFSHIHSLHVETFDEMMGSVEERLETRKGKQVLDIDKLIGHVLNRWTDWRQALRAQVNALFVAADINDDGVLSFDEFAACVRVILPGVSEERTWKAFRECIDLSPTDSGSGLAALAAAPGGAPAGSKWDVAAPAAAAFAIGGITAETFVSVVETQGLLGANLSAEHVSLLLARGEWKAPLTPGTGHSVDSPNANLSTPGKGPKRPPGGGGLTRIDSHAQLRIDLLHHEWSEKAESMRAQVGALREALAAMPRLAHTDKEREALAADLEAVPAQLEALTETISPATGAPPSVEDASNGWEQYRCLALKVTRLASRIDELAVAAPPSSAGRPSSRDMIIGKGIGIVKKR